MQQIYLFPSLDIAGLGLIGLTVEEENVHVGGELNRLVDSANVIDIVDITKHIYRVSKKKMVFSGKTAITTFKLIQNAKNGGVLENSGYLLLNRH